MWSSDHVAQDKRVQAYEDVKFKTEIVLKIEH